MSDEAELIGSYVIVTGGINGSGTRQLYLARDGKFTEDLRRAHRFLVRENALTRARTLASPCKVIEAP